jgi:sulfur-oxidizing protein SoxY
MPETLQRPFPNWSGNNGWALIKAEKIEMIGTYLRAATAIALAIAMSWSSARPSIAGDADDSWREIANNAFNGRPLADGSGLITLEMPARAEDAAVVPVTMQANLPPGDTRTLRSVTLVIDENPSPVAATFNVGPGVTMISTRVRVNSHTKVHAVAELSDGKLYVVETYVKASGGSSAPMANADENATKIGRKHIRQFAKAGAEPASTPREAQIMIHHPNNSGLQRDQVTLYYIPLFIVRQLRVWQGDQLVLEMDGGISISENPNIRFSYVSNGASVFRAEAVDTDGHVFKGEWPVEPAT